MRLIDADELFTTPMQCARHNGKPLTSLWAYVVDQITHAPTIDAVPVVRCKDCIHYEIHKPNISENCEREGRLIPMKPDDFCSYGERKDGEG